MALIPAERLVTWTPHASGAGTGVIGGTDQYYPGGASERVDLVNVKTDHGAAGVNTVTTGSITNGETTLVVADASSWAVGNFIRVSLPAIQTLQITQDATSSGTIIVNAPLLGSDPDNVSVAIVDGETAAQIAAKIRAKTFKTFTTGGSGDTVEFTQKEYYSISTVVRLNNPAYGGYNIDITYVGTQTQAGVLAVTHEVPNEPDYSTYVTAIVGNTLTISYPAIASVTNGNVYHDDWPAIQKALMSGVGDCVYLPAGTYPIYSSILGLYFNNRTMRGELVDGEIASFIDQRGGIFTMGGSSGGPPAATLTSVASGLAAGSTSVVLDGDMGTLAVGDIMYIEVENDETLPVVSVYGFNVFYATDAAPTVQVVTITGITGSTVTFNPPLISDFGGGALATRIQKISNEVANAGLEDLEIYSTNYHPGAAYNARMVGCRNSWFRNVNVKHAKNYPMSVSGSTRCEIRHCFIEGPTNTGSNGAGILFDGWSCLVEDNIIRNAFPLIETNFGSAGNAWLYNHDATPVNGGMWLTNHGPHCQFNLFEGNTMGTQLSDGYFGSDAFLTMFRNYFYVDGSGVNLRRFNRNTTVVANLMRGWPVPESAGFPFFNAGESHDGTAQPSLGDYWRDWNRTWELTARAGDYTTGEITRTDTVGRLFAGQSIRVEWTPTNCTSLYVTSVNGDGTVAQVSWTSGDMFPALSTEGYPWTGSWYNGSALDASWQERDLDVPATLLTKGNYSIYYDLFEDNLGGDTIPDSLAYSSQPDWWPDGFAWPPFDPEVPSTADAERLPAGYRYINGIDPDPEPGNGVLTCTNLNVTTFTIG